MDLIQDPHADATYKVADVARVLGITPRTARRYLDRGDWPHTWVGGRIKFSEAQVAEIKALWVRPVPASSQRKAG